MNLTEWSWTFLVVYVIVMIGFGLIGRGRVKNADDFATARGGYGPTFLAFAFAATTASGATFLGVPAMAYDAGLSAIWMSVLYPMGVYAGVLICARLVGDSGQIFGSRSIPEYLGQRYQSNTVRILVSLFSLLLLFYLAAQLVSGTLMFEMMLGLSPQWAMGITAVVLLVYVVLGGAHADILTDGVQGAIMVMIAVLVIVMFFLGVGVEGGFSGMIANLESQDANLVGWTNPDSVLFDSWWPLLAIFLAHLPLGLLPHIGNKLWALKESSQRLRFIRQAFIFGIVLAMLGLGGVLARAVLGDVFVDSGHSSNNALPALFIELFPAWLAALLGVGILAAVMSTADGLVISSSQIIANDLYRCTFVPRYRAHLDEATVDHHVLAISRVSTVVVMVACTAMAWALMDKNVALIVWAGTGGLMAAFAGPLVMGAVWSGVTKPGAYAGLMAGFLTFVALHGGMINPAWFDGGALLAAADWLVAQAPNPYSCAAIGELASVAATWAVSRLTRPLPADHLAVLFPHPQAH